MRVKFRITAASCAALLTSCAGSGWTTAPTAVPRSGDYKMAVRAWMGARDTEGQGEPVKSSWARYTFLQNSTDAPKLILKLRDDFNTLCENQEGTSNNPFFPSATPPHSIGNFMAILRFQSEIEYPLLVCTRDEREIFGMKVKQESPRFEEHSLHILDKRIAPVSVAHYDAGSLADQKREEEERIARAKEQEREDLKRKAQRRAESRAVREAEIQRIVAFQQSLRPGQRASVSRAVNPGPGGNFDGPLLRPGIVVEVRDEIVQVQFQDGLEWIAIGEVLPP